VTTPRDAGRHVPASDTYALVEPIPRTGPLRRPRWKLTLVDDGGRLPASRATLIVTGTEEHAVEVARAWVDEHLAGGQAPEARRVYGSGGPATGPTGSASWYSGQPR
jgi:hypothetical protein